MMMEARIQGDSAAQFNGEVQQLAMYVRMVE
jgi:hypothetical protein